VHHARFELADAKGLAVGEQVVELRAVGTDVIGVEDLPEDSLDFPNVAADGDAPTDLLLQVRCCRKVVGMRVRFEVPRDRQFIRAQVAEYAVRCRGGCAAGLGSKSRTLSITAAQRVARHDTMCVTVNVVSSKNDSMCGWVIGRLSRQFVEQSIVI